ELKVRVLKGINRVAITIRGIGRHICRRSVRHRGAARKAVEGRIVERIVVCRGGEVRGSRPRFVVDFEALNPDKLVHQSLTKGVGAAQLDGNIVSRAQTNSADRAVGPGTE